MVCVSVCASYYQDCLDELDNKPFASEEAVDSFARGLYLGPDAIDVLHSIPRNLCSLVIRDFRTPLC